jgi:hypothetical protein
MLDNLPEYLTKYQTDSAQAVFKPVLPSPEPELD